MHALHKLMSIERSLSLPRIIMLQKTSSQESFKPQSLINALFDTTENNNNIR